MTYIAQTSHSLAHSQAITSLVKTIEDRQGMVERTPFPAVQTEQTNVPPNELASTQQVMNPSSSSTTSRSTQYDTLVRTTTTMALANVTYDCAAGGNCTAPQVTSISTCMNADGTFPPVANDDT
mgnify:FL=1